MPSTAERRSLTVAAGRTRPRRAYRRQARDRPGRSPSRRRAASAARSTTRCPSSPCASARSCGCRSGARRSTAWWSGSPSSPSWRPERLVAPTGVREDDVPADLVELALWMADGVLLDAGAGAAARAAAARASRARSRGRCRTDAPLDGERLTDHQRALLDALPMRATGQLPRAAAARGARAGRDRGRASAAARRAPTSQPSRARRAHRRPGGRDRGGRGAAASHLLHGVTGSGKTEVYLRAAARGARARRGRDRARARDRAHAADRRALPGALRRHRRAAALRARRGRALRRVAAPAHAARRGSRSARARPCSRRSPTSA